MEQLWNSTLMINTKVTENRSANIYFPERTGILIPNQSKLECADWNNSPEIIAILFNFSSLQEWEYGKFNQIQGIRRTRYLKNAHLTVLIIMHSTRCQTKPFNTNFTLTRTKSPFYIYNLEKYTMLTINN